MAILKFEDTELEINDHEPIKEGAREIGVPFGCEDGLCGSCIIKVEEGMENLNERNDKEEDMGLEENQRLACQCNIKTGIVKINF
tara:strand:+ start:1040 stop:1294 length:255 start_codon:yes stop_codon:yes gene_type:complete